MHVIKRRGHKEKFDERKAYGSVYAACQICEMPEKNCEKIAAAVAKEIKAMVRKNKIMSSDDIFRAVVRMLRKHHKDAAFMYETHRDIS